MNKSGLYILLLLAPLSDCFAQDDLRASYSDFAKSSGRQYREYSKESALEFSRALRENWKTFRVFDAQVRCFVKPSSDTLLPACPVENVQIDISDVPVNDGSLMLSPKSTDAVAVYSENAVGCIRLTFPFYGTQVVCPVPATYRSLRLRGISERSVSSFWSALSCRESDLMMLSLRGVERDLNLNDWAMFEFVSELSKRVFPEGSKNEMAVFTVFCMNELGLRCRIARADGGLIPIFAAEQQIYGRRYVIVDGVKYYIAATDSDIAALNTYQLEIPGASSDMDMSLTVAPSLGDGSFTARKFESEVLGKVLSISLDTALISFYADYPQLDINVYAGAEPDSAFAEAMLKEIGPAISGKSGVESVNAILAFLQNDFRYRSDVRQFGKEKPFFCEENFYYPYNDCEDRAVLFSFLVRRLLGYDCLLLEYSDHVNCAVRTDEEAAGYYIRRGQDKYYVCDPACVGAKVGMSGRNYRIKPQKIWVISK